MQASDDLLCLLQQHGYLQDQLAAEQGYQAEPQPELTSGLPEGKPEDGTSGAVLSSAVPPSSRPDTEQAAAAAALISPAGPTQHHAPLLGSAVHGTTALPPGGRLSATGPVTSSGLDVLGNRQQLIPLLQRWVTLPSVQGQCTSADGCT